MFFHSKLLCVLRNDGHEAVILQQDVFLQVSWQPIDCHLLFVFDTDSKEIKN